MDTVFVVQALDIALRGGAAALVLLVAALLVREHGGTSAARLGAAFAIGVASYTVCSAPGFAAHAVLWHAPMLALCSGNTAVFWLFAWALFDDGFKHRWWHVALWLVLAGAGLFRFFVLAPAGSALAEIVGIALTLAALAFAALAVTQAVAGWRADLIEGRRRLRAFVVGGVAGYIAVIGAAELILRGGPVPVLASASNAAGLAGVSALIAWALLRVAHDGLFLEAPVPIVASTTGTPANGTREEHSEASDPKLLGALERLMTVERAYRQEGLTIGTLAVKLGMPEYRLRRLINQGLGQRNFNAFVNRYRIEDAKAALADPRQAEVPVLTIALDAGFRSLGPFNRAFKAETGVTPSEYRQSALARAASYAPAAAPKI